MEGITWLRIGTIAALFLGSMYVLAPTALQGDLEARRAALTQSVDTGTGSQSADLAMRFSTSDPLGAVVPVQKRLEAQKLGIERVREVDGQLEVYLKSGTKPSAVTELLAKPGEVTVYAADAIAPVPSPLPAVPADPPVPQQLWLALEKLDAAALGHWAPAANSWALSPVPSGITDLGLSVTDFDRRTFALSGPLPEGTPFVVVAVDGRMVGVGLPQGTGFQWQPLKKGIRTTSALEFLGDNNAEAVLVGGPLPAPLTPIDKSAGNTASTVAAAPPVETSVPSWLLGILPNTALQLGLDLQGGLDLTLQVELDDAVLAQVARDAAAIREQAATEKVTLTKVSKDKVEPILRFEGAEATELATFMRKRATEYVIATDDGSGLIAYRMTDSRVSDVQKQAVDQVLETLRKRVDATGVKEPSIVQKGGGRINVQLPGAVDLQAAVDAIGTTAVLEFRLVDMAFDNSVLQQILAAAQNTLPEDQWKDDLLVNEWLWDTKRLETDRQVFWHYEEVQVDGKPQMVRVDFSRDKVEGPIVLMTEVVLTGNDINDASVAFEDVSRPSVVMGFKSRGANIFCEITKAHVKDRFAIILDNQVRSAPSINEKICGGRASINMGRSLDAVDDANTLALVLKTGSLDAPVSIGEVRQVGATLGQDSIRQGRLATGVGGLVVLVFMAVWYRRAGMLANVALILNVVLVLAALAMFGATLTLPGIAGIALTVGMAVDANIIIFERIREELALGVAARKAVDEGFSKGVVAVLDANITTAIAGVVLYSYGTGPIKGFAVTLLLGIVTTLITALFVTRTLMDLATRRSGATISI